ncbi:penicillin-binding protein 2, partial [Actinomadura sp. DSM 109109]|nr:penicillin-binding protein 2 [Actinomadura lepetitiana]
MPPPRRDPGVRRFAPTWRWLAEGLWWVENAFNRARADARPEEDTRVRIFLILSVFSVVFVGLALGAANAALLKPKVGGALAASPNAVVRGDIVDRNGALLATNITHYGMYIDPAQVWDREAALVQIKRALPRASTAKLRRVLFG